ncbi:hypothetical protein ACT5YT_05180 [Leuconostoc suionicum]|uniref:hypothetical protein n=1 Tax=Leuconostoc suionicum TaxID=1511761 RepID=UPI004036B866
MSDELKSDILVKLNSLLRDNPDAEKIAKNLEEYSVISHDSIFMIDAPLMQYDTYTDYTYHHGALILIPNTRIIFVNFTGDAEDEDFEDYVDDVLADINSLIENFDFRNEIGRVRHWKREIVSKISYQDIGNIDSLISEHVLSGENARKQRLILSLLVGSINDAAKFSIDEPDNLLDKIKKQIKIFDSDQTEFMFDTKQQKQISIQGLAGTGKTELLLHKIVDLYPKKETRIVMTFFNKVLEIEMKKRLINFFDFMKVKEQIKWNERLWVMRGWGSQASPNSGVYSYICHYYGIPFQNLRQSGSLESACRDAIGYIDNFEQFDYCFDYVFIDESQDFPNSFFELCKKVTSTQVIIAGDIFQNIFSDSQSEYSSSADYVLSRVYRTNPKTFSFAQSIGFGLQEPTAIRHLTAEEWRACGYLYDSVDDDAYTLSRVPIKRFDDVEETEEPFSVQMVKSTQLTSTVTNVISELKTQYENITPNDIGVIVMSEYTKMQQMYNAMAEISTGIQKNMGWKTEIGVRSQKLSPDKVFISNQNNIKGLEFPFVIVVVLGDISLLEDSNAANSIHLRNSLYMMLTRSFISSHLIMNDSQANQNFIGRYNDEMNEILTNGKFLVNEKGQKVIDPSALHQLSQAVSMTPDQVIVTALRQVYGDNTIQLTQSLRRQINKLCDALNVNPSDIGQLTELITNNKSGINIYGDRHEQQYKFNL